MSMGTKMVDRMAHFDVADVMRMFNMPVSRMMPNSVMPEGRPMFFRNSAPAMASSVPMLDLPNTYRNCAAKNANTMKERSMVSTCSMDLITSVLFLNEPEA